MTRGYFGIGIECCKNVLNYGTLFRTAQILEANFLFLIGRRFRNQCSDTMKSWRHIPVYSYDCFDDFYKNLPHDCRLIGIELDNTATPLEQYTHPERACYLLGAEDHGLTVEARRRCHSLLILRGDHSMNVSVAGSIVLYHRVTQLSPLDNMEHKITVNQQTLPAGAEAATLQSNVG